MSETERKVAMAACMLPSLGRVRQISGRWFVMDIERPGEMLAGPLFRTKREAMRYAEDNASAVFKRLREDQQCS